MPKISGTLKKAGKLWQVVVPTKKGSAPRPIPQSAQRFSPNTPEGTQVDVETDAANNIVKVTVPGQPEVRPAAPPAPPQQKSSGGKGGWSGGAGGGAAGKGGGARGFGGGGRGFGVNRPSGRQENQQPAKRKLPKAPASILGMPFHNPYTFVPFASHSPVRQDPTWLSADEQLDGASQAVRYTGVVELEITTLSPLVTCESRPYAGGDARGGEQKHKKYRTLSIGSDVIVPATGIRGALRNLLTIITGGALTHVNRHSHLVQGRDVNLGPATLNSKPGTPAHVFLAEVERPGTVFRAGIIRVGKTKLIKLEDLERIRGFNTLKDDRKPKARPLWAKLDAEGNLLEVSDEPSPNRPWKVKLSGRPVNVKGKREGVLLVDTSDQGKIELPTEFWADYSGRNAFGDRAELKKGDLVWLEPVDPNQPPDSIRSASQIRSLQWSRWGKRGQPLLSKLPESVHPDYMRDDGKVDEVTNLFGQVSPERGSQSRPFAARVRPENLVFFDGVRRVQRDVALAPLSQPHPGCVAFYRDNTSADNISDDDLLRGYKVYRTTSERGDGAPWRYQTQGVYGSPGRNDGLLRQPPEQTVNKTCDLVPEGLVGELRISFRSLTARELALLLQACHVTWRLGGGKPLGLGQCRVVVKNLIDEEGQPLAVSGWKRVEQAGSLIVEGWQQSLDEQTVSRAALWEATQKPVAKLRYPRAVDETNHGKTRGGHVWFQRHAKPRMVVEKEGDQSREPGIEPMDVVGELADAARRAEPTLDARIPLIEGQILPPFDPSAPESDLLYAYDGYGEKSDGGRERAFRKLEQFDEKRHVSGQESSEGNQGKNANFRRDQRKDRGEDQK
jgi:CRISPR-associated protein (TIGR03986 family)